MKMAITGGEVEIDEEDFADLSRFTWFVKENRGKKYAVRGWRSPGKQHRERMHRRLCPCYDRVDHENGDGLDNRKKNLRAATQQQNNYNQRLSSHNTSGFKGVSWSRQANAWRVSVLFEKRQVHGGFHTTPELADEAARALRRRLHGKFARDK